jgi:hypothetical protein
MSTGAIISAIVGWVIIFGVLWICTRQIGKGGKWED